MKCAVNVVAAVMCGLTWFSTASSASADGEQPPAAKPQGPQAVGIDWGSKTAIAVVARDKAAWDSALVAAGKQQMLPIGMPKGDDLAALGNIDFGKQMIVAVFWGEKSFSRRSEKCRIERVSVAGGEFVVDCRAKLWGGAVDAAYRAWPYHAMVVGRSEMPVRFRQTTEWESDPNRTEKERTIAVVGAKESKQELSNGK